MILEEKVRLTLTFPPRSLDRAFHGTVRRLSRDRAGIWPLAVIAAAAIWPAVKPGTYGASGHGCITVTLPSSTGGALIHPCGAAAKATCKHAFAADDKVSQLTRPQCRLAGLSP